MSRRETRERQKKAANTNVTTVFGTSDGNWVKDPASGRWIWDKTATAKTYVAPVPKRTVGETIALTPRNTGYPLNHGEAVAEFMQTEAGRQRMKLLIDMHGYMRPADSRCEDLFIERFIDVLPTVQADDYGNRWLEISNPDGSSSNILWSSHTDTVHLQGGMQRVVMQDGMLYVPNSSCLGADDTAGIWIMLQMIEAQVPGVYVFHREEECGGHGSIWINRHKKDWLKGIDCAIAFDRKGYDSVITHQFGRCCSDDFAKSLAWVLGGKFEPDDTGIFTDTANYTDNIGECTNLSVGYHSAHGPMEHLDVDFLIQLRERVLSADFTSLVFKRKPGEGGMDDWRTSYGSYDGYGYGGTRSKWTKYEDVDELEEWVRKNPHTMALYLDSMGVSVDELDEFMFKRDAEPSKALGWEDGE